MFILKITKTRPNQAHPFIFESTPFVDRMGGSVINPVTYNYEKVSPGPTTGTSEDFVMTKTWIADNRQVLDQIVANLQNPEHQAYNITKVCNMLGFTTTYEIEEKS